MSEIVTVNIHTGEDTAIGLSKLDQGDLHVLTVGPVRVFLSQAKLKVLSTTTRIYLGAMSGSNATVARGRWVEAGEVARQRDEDEANGAYDYLEVG